MPSLVSLCRIRARRNKYSGRRRISETSVVGGLETGSAVIQSDSGSLGGKSGPLCELLERSATDFRQPVSAAGSLEHRRSVTELESSSRILSPPPFNLIPFCLTKVRQEQAEIVLVTPYLPSQCWFPSLMELGTDTPLLLFPSKSLLTSPLAEGHPLTEDESIRLIGWRLSGVVWKSEAFRKKLSSSYWEQLDQIHTLHTSPLGSLGAVDVINGTTIPCRLASRRS